ncbi:MAG: alpha/beta fold hydrolase [Deltaproteobacteria bacterium]
MSETVPGFCLGEGGERGVVVLVHGFTGSPWDLLPVGELLAEAGYEVSCRRLPGHGFPQVAEDNAWPAWLAEAQAGLDAAIESAAGRRVAVAGLSMGALLTLQLARANADSIHAIANFAPAVELSTFNRLGIGLMGAFAAVGLGAIELPKGGVDSQDPEVQKQHPGSNPFPFAAFGSFGQLREQTRAMVGEVSTPLLILHGALDGTCPVAGSAWLAQAVGSSDVSRHILERSGHVITRDIQIDELGEKLVAFLGRTLAGPA